MERSVVVAVLTMCAVRSGLVAQPGPPNDRVAVLIGFNRSPGPGEEALVRSMGGVVRHLYRILPAIAATLPQPAIRALENNQAVSVVEPDMKLQALDEYTSAWGVAKIGSQTVHTAGNTGNGVRVCIIDSGMDLSHPDLTGRFAGGWDFVNGAALTGDDNGHGTHVAGTIAAILNQAGVVGVSPGASILAYKILDASGSGNFSDAIAAIERCQADGGKVTNNSYGSGGDPGTLVKAAFDNAYSAGILNVASAGNADAFSLSCDSVSYPAAYDSVIAVAATDSSDAVAYFSCRGPEVELAAPGVNVNSLAPGGGYALMSGTSMASPHVAGLAALVSTCGVGDLNGDGRVNNIDVRLRMQQTALDLGTPGRDTSYGFGRVQAGEAAMGCTTSPPPAQVPAAPGNLTVTATNKSNVKLTWADNSTNESTFEVWRCTGTSCTDFARTATLSANTASYNNTGLSRRTTYRYQVRAGNSAGASVFSNIVAATTR